MKLSRKIVKYGLLSSVTFLCMVACTKLFSPCGSGDIPDTERTEELLKGHVFQLASSIGERNVYRSGTMEASAIYIEN